MNVYLLGSSSSDSTISGLLSKWNIQKIENEQGFKSTLDRTQNKVPHFIMEVSEVNEKKYSELKAISARYGKKIKFIVYSELEFDVEKIKDRDVNPLLIWSK